MTTSGNAVRVGAVALAAIALVLAMVIFFSGSGVFSKTYSFDVLFDDVQGVSPDSPVTLAGVQIGTVNSVKLRGGRADLRLKIKQQYQIPHGSAFTIATPILGTSSTVTVVPPTLKERTARNLKGDIQPDESLVGARGGDLTSSLAHANTLIDQLTQTTKTANALLADQQLQGGLKGTVANLNQASAGGVVLTRRLNTILTEDNAQIQALLAQTRSGSQVALGNINDTTGQIKQITTENHANINSIVSDLRDTTAAISGITAQTNEALSNGGVTKNLSATVANLKLASDKLTVIADNFQKLSGDSGLQGDLRATLHNVRQSTEETTLLLQRLNKLAGSKRQTVVVAPGGSLPTVIVTPPGPPSPHSDAAPLLLPRLDLRQNTRLSRFRADIDAVVPVAQSPGAFARAGIYDFGGNSKLILQGGRMLGKNSAFDMRAGLYASKLSVGADAGLGKKATLSLDLYDPNNYHLDALGVLMLNSNIGLTLGADDITRHPGLSIGIESRR